MVWTRVAWHGRGPTSISWPAARAARSTSRMHNPVGKQQRSNTGSYRTTLLPRGSASAPQRTPGAAPLRDARPVQCPQHGTRARPCQVEAAGAGTNLSVWDTRPGYARPMPSTQPTVENAPSADTIETIFPPWRQQAETLIRHTFSEFAPGLRARGRPNRSKENSFVRDR